MPLSNCLMKFGTAPGSERFLPRVDRRDLIDNAKTYAERGLTQEQAEIKAAGDRLQELRAEEKRINDAVQAEWDKQNPVEVRAEVKPEPVMVEKAASTKSEARMEASIADFGEKLEGARKDMVVAMKREYSDDEISSLPLSKIWPSTEVDAIPDKYVAAVAFAAREEIPSKPRVAYKVKTWVEKVKVLRGLAQYILNDTITKSDFSERLKGIRGLDNFESKVRLLEAIDRDQWKRIGNVAERPGAYRYDKDGNKIPSSSVAVHIDGKYNVFEGATSVEDVIDGVNEKLGIAVDDKKIQFQARGSDSRGYFIHKKGDREYRKLKIFKTGKEALDYLDKNHADLVAAWNDVKNRDNVKKSDIRSEDNRPRTGKDHRQGKDVSVEHFAETFGFRGGQFGNWVKQGNNDKDRQWMLNNAYDALMDLSNIIDVPPRALSLEGQLGISFGARGSGSASAHYEPDTLIINLTKTRGAGNLAHEWFHALDNYFQRRRGVGAKREGRYITYAPEAYYENAAGTRIPANTFETAVNSDPAAQRYGLNAAQRTIAFTQRQIGDKTNWTKRDAVRPEVEQKFAALVDALNASPMKRRAAMIDAGKENGYWSRIIELGARAFENYTLAKMAEHGYHNDYLANVVSPAEFQRDVERYPYLLDEELKPVVDAFDDLFATIDTKETDDGIALFNQSTATAASTFDQSLFDQAKSGTTAKPILKAIAQQSTSPFNKVLARALMMAGINSKVEFGRAEDMNFAPNSGLSADDYAAAYRPRADKVFLFGARSAERNLLHELSHAATFKAMQADGKYAQEMTALYEQVKKSGIDLKHYGMSDVLEFIAEGFSNPDFQSALKRTPMKNIVRERKNAWSWFVDLVRRILNLKDGNALSEFMEVGARLLDENQAITESQSSDMAVGSVNESPALNNESVLGNVKQDWVNEQPAETQEFLRKAGMFREAPTLKQRFKEWAKDWKKSVNQGVFDQFAPLKNLDYKAYIHARLTNSNSNVIKGMLFAGKPYLDADGAVQLKYEEGGFVKHLQNLNGEDQRWLSWVIAKRANDLMAQGREHNFTPEQIKAGLALNQGTMPDGRSRSMEYAKTNKVMQEYNKAALDMAEKAGEIDPETRKTWESDFYVPFYRVMEETDAPTGPKRASGLVNQYAFKSLKGGVEALGDPLENILNNWSHLISSSLRNQAARESLLAAENAGVATEANEETARSMAKDSGKKSSVVSFMDGGVKRWFVVDDPFVLQALQSIGYTGSQMPGMKVMQSFKHWLSLGVTVSPTYRIRNIIRDSIQMIGTNPASYNILNNLVSGFNGTDPKSQEFWQFFVGGGALNFNELQGKEGAKHLQRLVNAGIKDQDVLDTPEKIKDTLTKAWDWWQETGERAESINRSALYQKLIADGKSHLEASFAARDAQDFSLQGTWAAIRFLTQSVPFFNARLQGMYKLGRAAKEDPKRFAAVVGGVAMASIALMLAYKDDDDWKNREDWDKETYWWFKVGDKAVRIPKPFEVGALATLFERGLEAMVTDELTGKQFAERMGAIVWQQLSMNPVPQILMPAIELWANKDSFTGNAIETAGMENLSTSERAGPNTSAVAQLAGKAGLLSPVQIDHLVNGYFGWMGTHIVAAADLGLRPAMGLPDKAAPRIDDMFVAGDFVKSLPAYQSKYVTQLYDQGKQFQEVLGDLHFYQKTEQFEKARELMQEHGTEIRLGMMYQKAQAELGKINTQIKRAQMQNIDPETKRQRLDGLYAARDRMAQATALRSRTMQQQAQ